MADDAPLPVARVRPVLTTRPAPEPENRNPFLALDEVHRELVTCHEHLSALATKLAGNLPAYEATKDEPGGAGLLGLSFLTAVSMRHRIRHITELVNRIEEHLR